MEKEYPIHNILKKIDMGLDFYCRVCIKWFKKVCDDSYFGPTLLEEMQRKEIKRS